jgi:hypothetical protein
MNYSFIINASFPKGFNPRLRGCERLFLAEKPASSRKYTHVLHGNVNTKVSLL